MLAQRRIVYRLLFSDETQYSRDRITSTRNSQLCSTNIHWWSVERSLQRLFSLNVWSGLIGDLLIRKFVLEQHLTLANYLHFLPKELPLLLEHVPLETRFRMFFEDEGRQVMAHFNSITRLSEFVVLVQNLVRRSLLI
jgi:hypothetical protein